MRRTLLQVGVSLAGGAVVSRVVALACYYRSTSITLGERPLRPSELRLPGFIRGVWPPPMRGSVSVATTAGFTATTIACADPKTSARFVDGDQKSVGPAEFGVYTYAYGWPARSAWTCRPCVFTSGGNGDHMDVRAIFDDFDARAWLALGVEKPWLPGNRATHLPVPVAPLWDGLALNAALYGSAAWCVLVAPGIVRRARRRRSGRCLRCGYDLRGLAGCPECGARRTASAV